MDYKLADKIENYEDTLIASIDSFVLNVVSIAIVDRSFKFM